LGCFYLNQIIPIGDFCNGLTNGLTITFIVFLILIILIAFTTINIISIIKKKKKFDFIPLIIVITIGTSYYAIATLDHKKFWTDTIISGSIQFNSRLESGSFKLYKNGSFGTTLHTIEASCTFQGNYSLKGDTLILQREDLSQVTENIFTTTYILNKNTQTLNPTDTNFKPIPIKIKQ